MAKKSAPTNVIGYARLSQDREESTSIQRQHKAIGDLAALRGLTLVRIEDDVDVSASKARLDRPALTRVRQALASGEADAVVVWRMDRLVRNVGDLSTLLDEGMEVISCTENLDTTSAMGRAFVEIVASLGAAEARSIAERVSSSREALAHSGRFGGGTTPYGYEAVPNKVGAGQVLKVVPSEAKVIKRAARLVISGQSTYAVVQELNAKGYKPRRAAKWSIQSLTQMLTGESVLGHVVHRGKVVRDDEGLPIQPWPAIITADESNKLRSILAPKRTIKRRASRLLSGLCVCGTCDETMRVGTGSASGLKGYRCQNAECTRQTSINAEALENWIADEILGEFGTLPEMAHTEESPREDLAVLEAAISHAARDLGEEYSEERLTRLRALQSRREALQSQPQPVAWIMQRTGRTWAEAWEVDDVSKRREVVRSLTRGRIVIAPGVKGRKGFDKDRVVIDWDV